MLLQNWWYTTLLGLPDPIQPPLRGDVTADVVIVGGGAAGLAAAMRLREAGKGVVLVERNICGGSTTGKSSGFLTPDSELELNQLERRFGLDGARVVWDAPVRGVELMRKYAQENDIDCDLLPLDSLFLGKGKGGRDAVQEEFDARKKLGFAATRYDAAELPTVIGSSTYSAGVRYPGTFGVNGMRYAQGMKRALLRRGVRIFEATEVNAIEDHTVRTHMGSVTAEHILICADKLTPALTPQSREVFHAQTFLSISEPLDDDDMARTFPDGGMQCWDSDLVYSYFRPTGDKRLLVGGGSMLTTYARQDVTNARAIGKVIHDFKRRFPHLEHLRFLQYWPGRIDTTRDLLPTLMLDERSPHIGIIMGAPGLPWATFCGDLAARTALGTEGKDRDYYRYFGRSRGFFVPDGLVRLLGKQLSFSINQGWAKYYQKDARGADPGKP